MHGFIIVVVVVMTIKKVTLCILDIWGSMRWSQTVLKYLIFEKV